MDEVEIVVFNYEKKIRALEREIDRLCTENSRIRLELMRAQAENAKMKAFLFPHSPTCQQVSGFKVYQ